MQKYRLYFVKTFVFDTIYTIINTAHYYKTKRTANVTARFVLINTNIRPYLYLFIRKIQVISCIYCTVKSFLVSIV